MSPVHVTGRGLNDRRGPQDSPAALRAERGSPLAMDVAEGGPVCARSRPSQDEMTETWFPAPS
jgi:hypothetical protein